MEEGTGGGVAGGQISGGILPHSFNKGTFLVTNRRAGAEEKTAWWILRAAGKAGWWGGRKITCAQNKHAESSGLGSRIKKRGRQQGRRKRVNGGAKANKKWGRVRHGVTTKEGNSCQKGVKGFNGNKLGKKNAEGGKGGM